MDGEGDEWLLHVRILNFHFSLSKSYNHGFHYLNCAKVPMKPPWLRALTRENLYRSHLIKSCERGFCCGKVLIKNWNKMKKKTATGLVWSAHFIKSCGKVWIKKLTQNEEKMGTGLVQHLERILQPPSTISSMNPATTGGKKIILLISNTHIFQLEISLFRAVKIPDWPLE